MFCKITHFDFVIFGRGGRGSGICVDPGEVGFLGDLVVDVPRALCVV